MDSQGYRSILFNAGFHAMACDGEIHESEINAIVDICNKLQCFADLNLDTELQNVSVKFQESVRGSFRAFFDSLKSDAIELNEKLQIIDVIIRVIHSDNRIDENEILYLKKVIGILKVPMPILTERFKSILSILKQEDSVNYLATGATVLDFTAPSFSDMENLELLNVDRFKEEQNP